MKYEKPEIYRIREKLPPITTNFAPPPVEIPESPIVPTESRVSGIKIDKAKPVNEWNFSHNGK